MTEYSREGIRIRETGLWIPQNLVIGVMQESLVCYGAMGTVRFIPLTQP